MTPTRARAALFLAFLAWPVFLVSPSGPSMADSVLLATMRLADRGTWTLADGLTPREVFLTRAHDISAFEGRVTSGLGPGATLAALPVYVALRGTFDLFDDGIVTNRRVLGYYLLNARGLGIPPAAHFRDLYLLQILAAWLVVAPLFAWFLVRLHARLLEGEASPAAALAVTLAAGFGSMTLYYCTMYSRQALASLLLWHAFLSLTGRRKPGAGACLAAGAAAGAAVAVDYASLIFIVVALPFPLIRLARGRRIQVTAALLALLALTGLYHRALFGSFLSTPYHHRFWHTPEVLAERGIDLASFQSGPTVGIGLPDPVVMARLCFGPAKGLFLHSPVLLLGLAGHIAGLRGGTRRRLHLMSLLLFGAYLAFNSSLGSGMGEHALHFWGGLSVLWGPRYLLATIPFLAWGMIRLDWSRTGIRILALSTLAVSCLMNMAAASFSHILLATPAFGEDLHRPLAYVLGLLMRAGPRIPLLDDHGASPRMQWTLLSVLLGLSAMVVHRAWRRIPGPPAPPPAA